MNPINTFKIYFLPENRGVLPYAAALILFNICQQSFHSVWVLYAKARFNWSAFYASIYMTCAGAYAILVQGYVIRKLIPRIGKRSCAMLGLVMGLVLNLAVAFVADGWMIYVALPLGALEGLAAPSLQSIIVKRCTVSLDNSAEKQGSIQGAVQGSLSSLQTLSKIIAATLATQLFSFGISEGVHPGTSFMFGATLNLLALFILHSQRRAKKQEVN